MEVKKNPDADIDRKKSSIFALGFMLVTALTLCAFEYTVWDDTSSEIGEVVMDALEDEIIDEAPPEVTPPPPPPPEITVIEIVDDEEDVPETNFDPPEVTEDFVVEEPIVQEEEEVVEEQIFTIVEESPQFPGGEEKMYEYLRRSVKYPQMAKDAGVSGKVYVNFVVDKDGSITNVTVKRGIGSGCDKEAVRVIKAMPNWSPGKQRGKAVKVSYTMPINFVLK